MLQPSPLDELLAGFHLEQVPELSGAAELEAYVTPCIDSRINHRIYRPKSACASVL